MQEWKAPLFMQKDMTSIKNNASPCRWDPEPEQQMYGDACPQRFSQTFQHLYRRTWKNEKARFIEASCWKKNKKTSLKTKSEKAGIRCHRDNYKICTDLYVEHF